MLEAMREGIPVLASNIPPHQQLIHDNRGILFRAGNLDSCVHSLNWAINHLAEMAVMAKNAQRHVQLNYGWDCITSETLKLYTTILNSPDPVGVSEPSNLSSRVITDALTRGRGDAGTRG